MPNHVPNELGEKKLLPYQLPAVVPGEYSDLFQKARFDSS
jgi:hypothetical protein